jgi:hypothetical protein
MAAMTVVDWAVSKVVWKVLQRAALTAGRWVASKAAAMGCQWAEMREFQKAGSMEMHLAETKGWLKAGSTGSRWVASRGLPTAAWKD